ncbi:hypothetical protein CCAX7_57460 [Capsulimonas corticalis]|uniref:Uncharacterized protein n=1 Tax=Capsulimonas corticalis TaxID=2219043 RepID=A0A402D074_9BACT|nr:hypothetical protein [Capsulimonas corticalis]BDI33695.1 hypothetical protein CCAX7_57460 [Capsulimonas corticalis]
MTTPNTSSWRGGDADGEMRSWCCGMPLAEERRLTPEEAADVRSEAARLKKQSASAFLGIFGGLIVLASLSRALGRGSHAVGLEIALEFFAGFAGVSWLLLSAESPLRRSEKLIRDLKQGAIRVFRGEVKGKDAFDSAQTALIKLHALQPAEGRAQTMLVLPEARRVWSVNGRRVARWVSARSSEVAQQPPFAAMAAQWLAPTGRADAGELISTGQRELSRAERTEIRRCIRRHWTRPLPAAVVLTAWLLWPVAAAWWTGGAVRASDWSSGVLTHLWAVMADIAMGYGLLQAYKLTQDLRDGSVQIVKLTPQERSANDAEAAGAPKKAQVETLVEYLPVSLRLWTEDGAPTAWRRLAG